MDPLRVLTSLAVGCILAISPAPARERWHRDFQVSRDPENPGIFLRFRGGGATVSRIGRRLWKGYEGEEREGAFLEKIGVDLGHQEVQSILSEVEQIFESQPLEWLPVDNVANLLAYNLGYEDVDEMEAAINMEFSVFLAGFPHIQIRKKGRGKKPLEFTLKRESESHLRKPLRMRYIVNSTKDLWTVFLKSKNCIVWIPELEFEIRPDGRKRIDTLYNHIGAAVFNLGYHVRQGTGKFMLRVTVIHYGYKYPATVTLKRYGYT
ncbi:hypothetical protein AAMO2058_001265600 [Amorphochlora amoebiformis]